MSLCQLVTGNRPHRLFRIYGSSGFGVGRLERVRVRDPTHSPVWVRFARFDLSHWVGDWPSRTPASCDCFSREFVKTRWQYYLGQTLSRARRINPTVTYLTAWYTSAHNNTGRYLNDDMSIVITPDGPRGPRYKVQPGAVLLAEATGVPVIPYSVNAPHRWDLKGWDRTQIPKPFSRVEVVIGHPLHVPPKLSPEGRAAACEQLLEAMMAITRD